MIAGAPLPAAWLAGVVPSLLAVLLHGLLALLGLGVALVALGMMLLGGMLLIALP